MVCLANKRSRREMAVRAADALAIPPAASGTRPASRATAAAAAAGAPTWYSAARRVAVGVPRAACPSSRVERRQKKCGPSEEALIHHTSLAACHLNAKYLQRIFKTKTRKEMSGRSDGGMEGWRGEDGEEELIRPQ